MELKIEFKVCGEEMITFLKNGSGAASMERGIMTAISAVMALWWGSSAELLLM